MYSVDRQTRLCFKHTTGMRGSLVGASITSSQSTKSKRCSDHLMALCASIRFPTTLSSATPVHGTTILNLTRSILTSSWHCCYSLQPFVVCEPPIQNRDFCGPIANLTRSPSSSSVTPTRLAIVFLELPRLAHASTDVFA